MQAPFQPTGETNRPTYRPALPLNEIADDVIEKAKRLREALRPWLIRRNDLELSAAEMEAAGVEDYNSQFGNRITTRYWRELFMRTIRRDNGAEAWNRLEIYLPERLKAKYPVAKRVPESMAADFGELESFLTRHIQCPEQPTADENQAVWTLALLKYQSLVIAGEREKKAARRVRQFLFARAPFLAASRDALWIAFKRKIAALKNAGGDVNVLCDKRAANGPRPDYPSKDVRRVRHSAALKNGGRIDAAWREEYRHLSEYTRQRHGFSWTCPAAFCQRVNRAMVDALRARQQGKRTLHKLVGYVTRDAENIPAMARWAVDDVTSNIEVAFRNKDGTVSLIQPQIIAVMDFASRKWVGWSMSNDKAPTAELVCEGVLDAIKTHDVPKTLWLENGFVFGRSLNVNGKRDERGRTDVAGLAQYGCVIHHFGAMNPTSKAELEKSFDLIQRLMERHPGYGGRNQMLDASEDFKRQQRLIRSGKVAATDYRYTYEEFPQVLHKLVEEYNSTPQHGHLNGLSPNEAFEAMKDANDPPITFDNRLHWMLANERYRVEVRAGGVSFTHYGRPIKVRGGDLANPELIGTELWALVDRQDDSMVTFMTLDYSRTFTVETCQKPSADESRIASSSGILGKELGKVRQHMRAVDTEFKGLKAEFGDPRQDLLAEIRNQPRHEAPLAATRATIIDPQLADSAAEMEQQRHELRQRKKEEKRQHENVRRFRKITQIAAATDAPADSEDDSILIGIYGRKSDEQHP